MLAIWVGCTDLKFQYDDAEGSEEDDNGSGRMSATEVGRADYSKNRLRPRRPVKYTAATINGGNGRCNHCCNTCGGTTRDSGTRITSSIPTTSRESPWYRKLNQRCNRDQSRNMKHAWRKLTQLIVMTQLGANTGVKRWGDQAIVTIIKEIQQIHNMKVIDPIHATAEQRR